MLNTLIPQEVFYPLEYRIYQFLIGKTGYDSMYLTIKLTSDNTSEISIVP